MKNLCLAAILATGTTATAQETGIRNIVPVVTRNGSPPSECNLFVYSTNGTLLSGPHNLGFISTPSLAMDSGGNVWVAGIDTVKRYYLTSDLQPIEQFSITVEYANFSDIAIAPDNSAWVIDNFSDADDRDLDDEPLTCGEACAPRTDPRHGRIFQFTPDGTIAYCCKTAQRRRSRAISVLPYDEGDSSYYIFYGDANTDDWNDSPNPRIHRLDVATGQLISAGVQSIPGPIFPYTVNDISVAPDRSIWMAGGYIGVNGAIRRLTTDLQEFSPPAFFGFPSTCPEGGGQSFDPNPLSIALNCFGTLVAETASPGRLAIYSPGPGCAGWTCTTFLYCAGIGGQAGPAWFDGEGQLWSWRRPFTTSTWRLVVQSFGDDGITTEFELYPGPGDRTPFRGGDPTGYTQALTIHPDLDFDGDGIPNRAELLANRNPFSSDLATSPGTALLFDGVDDHIVVDDPPTIASEVTVEAWVHPSDLSADQIGIAGTWNDFLPESDDRTYALWVTGGRAEFAIGRCGGPHPCGSESEVARATDSSALSADEWTHLAGTYDGNVAKLYRNGVLVGESDSLALGINSPEDLPLYIGRTYTGGGPDSCGSSPCIDHFTGKLDEIRLWNRALTETEIRRDMTRSLPGNELGLLGYWRFDEGQGGTSADQSGNGLTANLGSMEPDSEPQWVPSDAPIGTPACPELVAHAQNSNYDYKWLSVGNIRVTDTDDLREIAAVTTTGQPFLDLYDWRDDHYDTDAWYPLPSSDPTSIECADLDLNGAVDVVIAFEVGRVQSWLGDGAPPYLAAHLPTPTLNSCVDHAVGLLDGDPYPDAIVAVSSPVPGLELLLGDGQGGFAPSVFVGSVGRGTPVGVSLCDTDEDGDLDVIVAHESELVLVMNDGMGGLSVAASIPFPSTCIPTDLACGQIDKDPDIEVVLACGGTDSALLFEVGPGGLLASNEVFLSGTPVSAAFADIDYNYSNELLLVLAQGRLVTLSLDDGGALSLCSEIFAGVESEVMAAAELDGDGGIDAIVTGRRSPVGISLLSSPPAPPGAHEGVLFPAEDASFGQAQPVTLTEGGGATAPFDDFSAASGPPDALDVVGSRTYSLGSGGSLVLEFADIAIANTGDDEPDLYIFEVGQLPERVFVALRPSGIRTERALQAAGVVLDDGFAPLGGGSLLPGYIDIDAFMGKFQQGELRFDAVRLTDDPENGVASGPDAGADIDSVGAITAFSRLPDLEIESPQAPGSGIAGQIITVRWAARNIGDFEAAAPWTNRVTLSGPSGVTELDSSPVLSIVPSAADWRQVDLLLPEEAGAYTLTIEENLGGQLVEDDSSNNVLSIPIEVEQDDRPDLTVALSSPSSTYVSGSLVTLTMTVTNSATASSNAPFWTDRAVLSVAGQDLIWSGPNLAYLAPGQSYDQTVHFVLPHDVTGPIQIQAITDVNDEVVELDEGNNSASVNSQAELEGQPNLTPDQIGASGTVQAGDLIDVTWIDRNIATTPCTQPGQACAETDATGWQDSVYISVDASLSPDDILLGTLSVAGPLSPGEATNLLSKTVSVPVDWLGTAYFLVHTDSEDVVSEFGYEGDNSQASNPVDVISGSRPDLVPFSVQVSPGPTSSGQLLLGHPLNVHWQVNQEGTAPQTAWPAFQTHSWLDRMYLRPQSGGTNVLLAGSPHSSAACSDWCSAGCPTGCDPGGYSKDVQVASLDPATFSPGTYDLVLRVDDAQAGGTHAWGGIFEADEGNNELVLPDSVTILDLPSDLEIQPDGGTLPTEANPGDSFSLSFTVSNSGQSQTPTNQWTDRIYLEGPTGTHLLRSLTRQGGLPIGDDYTTHTTVTIPYVQAGTYQIVFDTDVFGQVYEGPHTSNNTFAASIQVTDAAPDLEVLVNPQHPPLMETAPGGSFELRFELANTAVPNGDVEPYRAYGPWRCRAYLDPGNVALGTWLVQSVLEPSLDPLDHLSFVETVTMPFIGTSGAHTVRIVADVDGNVFEQDEANNTATLPITVLQQGPDLVPLAKSLMAQSTLESDDMLMVQWTVRNVGTHSTHQAAWIDRVYLERVTGTGCGSDRLLLGGVARSPGLGPGQEYTSSGSFAVPSCVSGCWQVVVEVDDSGSVWETDDSNNSTSRKVVVESEVVLPADLTVISAVLPAEVDAGQELTVTYDLRNVGQGPAVGLWTDRVTLSQDSSTGGSDVLLGVHTHPMSTVLPPFDPANPDPTNGSVQVTRSFIVPLGTPAGYYHVLIEANENGGIDELGAPPNNVYVSTLVHIRQRPPGDLVIDSVTPCSGASPCVASLDQPLSVDWVQRNAGSSEIVGSFRDSVFLTTSNTALGPNAVLVSQHVTGAPLRLSAGASYTMSENVLLPGVLPGDYFVAVQTDVLNQIPEIGPGTGEGEGNNVTFSDSPISVQMPEVTLDGGPSPFCIESGGAAWFALAGVPADRTIEVSVVDEDSESWIEVYIKRGAIPTPGIYDFRFNAPAESTQHVRIPSSQADGGTEERYYVLVRKTRGGTCSRDSLTISAETVPFGVTAVQPAIAGKGIVTFEIFGSQLSTVDPTDSVKLLQPGTGIELATSTEIHIVDASHLLATFDLASVAAGTGIEIVPLSGGSPPDEGPKTISIEPAQPYNLLVELELPESIRTASTGVATARVRNAGNVNIPHGLWVFGHSTNLTASSADEEVLLSSEALGLSGPEVDALGRESLVLYVKDLGPSQMSQVEIQLSVGPSEDISGILGALTGRPLSRFAFEGNLLLDLQEELRVAVLSDPSSSAELLSAAASPAEWESAFLAHFPADETDIFVPGTLPLSGRDLLRTVGESATGDLAVPGVGDQALAEVAGSLYCAPFFADTFDCSTLFPTEVSSGLPLVSVAVQDGAPVPREPVLGATPSSDDPNEKHGPQGIGPARQISSLRSTTFRVYFENRPEAAAHAARVEIRDFFQSTMNPASFRVGEIRFGDIVVPAPENTITSSMRLDLVDELGVLVDLFAGFDASSGEALWVLQAIDPTTGQPPTSGDVGVLPPNLDGSGEGYVEFRAGFTNGIITGTRNTNDAVIIFDKNQVIPTNTVENDTDADIPSSTVTAGAGLSASFDVQLSWTGDDAAEGGGVGSGIQDFTVYARRGLPGEGDEVETWEPWVPILVNTTSTSMTFTDGTPGYRYEFYSRARDRTGNQQPAPGPSDSGVSVDIPDDCNGNGIADSEDIAMGAADCNGNGVPDECDIDSGASEDCNGNAVPDSCEIASGGQDCNANGFLDECDIAFGSSSDDNADGIPDECQFEYYCFGYTGCPCANDSIPDSEEGCLHSSGYGMQLQASGSTSVAADSLTLTVSGAPQGNSGLFYAGTTQVTPTPILDGLQCTGGVMTRLRSAFQTDGIVTQTALFGADVNGIFVPGTDVYFQFWTRDVAAGVSACGTGASTSPGVRVSLEP